MSTSIIHVMTIIGKGAEQVEAACEELLGRRVRSTFVSGAGYGSGDWSERDHADLEKLCAALIRAGRKLPVLYYAQYLDSWSVGGSNFWLLEWPDAKKRVINGSNYDLVFYPSQFAPDFLGQIKKRQRTKLYRTQSEDRWYLDHVRDAIQSPLWLQAKFTVLSIKETLDGSRLDDEIKAALEKPIDLTIH